MIKVLVTGGTGFLGSHIALRLLERGDAVRILARRKTPFAENGSVEFVQGDVADFDTVRKACRGVDAVIHTAAKEGVEPNKRPFFQTNVQGTRNLLDACRAEGVPRFVFTSSPSAVDGGVPLEGADETLPYPCRSLSTYALTKRLAEEMVLGANSASFLTCAIRPRLIWGPGDRQLIPRVIEKARKGTLRQVGDGANLIDTTFIDNAAEAHLLALDALAPGSPVPGNAYFISQGEPVDCWEWINRILEMAGLPPVRKRLSFRCAYRFGALLEWGYALCCPNTEPPMTRFLATQLAQSYWFSIEKARRDLNYVPRVTLAEGAERLRAWLSR